MPSVPGRTIGFGLSVTFSLLRDDVHKRRTGLRPGPFQRGFDLSLVVAVHGAQISKPELLPEVR